VSRLLAIARKDATVVFRDASALLVMLAMPLALTFILGAALGGLDSGDTIDEKVAIVNLDEGETGAFFVEGLADSEEVAALFTMEVAEDAVSVRAAVERGDLTAALIIPADLTARIAERRPVTLEVLQDPGSQVTAGVWAGVVRAAVSSASAQIVAGRTLAGLSEATPGDAGPGGAITLTTVKVVDAEVAAGRRVSTVDYYAAGMTAMFLLFGAMFGAFAFIRERRERTLDRLLATPARRLDIMGGKALGIFGLAAGQFLVLLAGTGLVFGVDWGEAIGATIAVGLAEAVSAAGLAMTFTALGKTERAVGGIAPALIMFFAATGGSMIPAQFLPGWLLPLQVISPVYWANVAFLDLMGGAGFSAVLGPIAALLAIGVALFAFGLWRLRAS